MHIPLHYSQARPEYAQLGWTVPRLQPTMNLDSDANEQWIYDNKGSVFSETVLDGSPPALTP